MSRMLRLDQVSRKCGRPPHQRIVLHNLSLELEPGELVAIWGLRRSGRSTLLRVAAGVEAPDSGSVFYDGQELSSHPQLIGEAIAFCRRCPRSGELHSSVLEMLLYPQLARGTDLLSARARAHAALERTGANEHAMLAPGELEAGERTRVALAAALTLRPSLIVIDEPLMGVDPLERDPILALMRTLADDGTSILMSTGEAACLAGADRALTLSHGQLHGQATPQHAQLIPLYPRGHRAA